MRFTILLMLPGIAYAQARPLDWSFYGGDAQRTGWEKSDTRITKDNIKDFQLVLKRKLGNAQGGPRSLTPPVVIGNLISYKGFKELAFIAGGSGMLWSIDVDTDRIFWQKQLESSVTAKSSGACAASGLATPSLTPPMNFGARPRPAAGAPAAPPPASRSVLGSTNFGSPRPAFALTSDGKLHVLNTSVGDDLMPAIPFIPPNAKASSLTISDGAIYTTTNAGCGDAPSGVWSLDLSKVDPKDPAAMPKVASFRTNGGNVGGIGGLAFGTDGTLYLQTGDGPTDPASNKWSRTLLALTPKDLTVKQYFSTPSGSATKGASPATPVVFAVNGKDVVVTAGSDGALYLLDAQALGGDDHKTPLSKTVPLTTAGRGIWGGLSSWQDADGTRWVLAPVWGKLSPELKLGGEGVAHGAIVAFRVDDHEGKPTLTPAWASRDMSSPEPPVITSGVVFALSAGEYASEEKGSGHATLYAFDGATGKELYSTGSQVNAPANLTGMTLANGRVYFTTTDGFLYAFGIFLER